VLMPYVLSLVTRGGGAQGRVSSCRIVQEIPLRGAQQQSQCRLSVGLELQLARRVGEYKRYLSEVPSNNINEVYQLVWNYNLPDLVSFRTTDKMSLLLRR